MSTPRTRLWIAYLGLVAVAVGLPACGGGTASQKGMATNPEGTIGIEEKLGDTLPKGLMFTDSEGKEVELTSLFRKPTVLTLVYLRCTGICAPLLRELTKTVDELEKLQPGRDYDLVTVSFDPQEKVDSIKTSKKNYLASMKTKVPPDAWHFLTGDQANIDKLTDAVGFKYVKVDVAAGDKAGDEYKHAGTVMFLSKDGKIVRYLAGLEMLPFHMELALNDARDGNARSFMQKIQQLCYRYDPEGKTYALQVNKIILFVTLLGAGLFLFGVVLRKRRKGIA